MRSRIRIAIADSQPIFRLGMKTHLADQPDLEVVGEADRASAAIDLVRAIEPDVLIVEHDGQRLNGLAVIRELRALRTRTRAIVVAASMPEAEIQSALMLGAQGVVLKRTLGDTLAECVRQVAGGGHWIGLESVNALVSGLRAPGTSGSSSLTPREVDIVRRVAAGASNKDIASELKLGEQTVKNHLRRIFRKLRVASRVELALLTMEHQVALSDAADRTT